MTHIPEDLLDEYALGRVADPALADIEQHLLICEECREAVAQIDQIRSILRISEDLESRKH